MRERFISVIFTVTETGFFHIKRIVRHTSCRSSVVMQGTNERRKVKSIIPVSAGIHRLAKSPRTLVTRLLQVLVMVYGLFSDPQANDCEMRPRHMYVITVKLCSRRHNDREVVM